MLFFCFSENVGINKAYEKCKNFCDQIGETAVTPASITKFFSLVRDKIRIKMHKIWEKELLGIEINPEFGYPAVEIDESKIISSGEEIYWMFGAIDRNTKDARIWCVLKDRTKARLLPLIKNILIQIELSKKTKCIVLEQEYFQILLVLIRFLIFLI